MPRRPRKLAPIHPGEVLLEDFLSPLGISQYRLAKDTTVPPRRINEIVHGDRAISADTALRLARYFGTSERFWLNLQDRYDIEVERDRLRQGWHRKPQPEAVHERPVIPPAIGHMPGRELERVIPAPRLGALQEVF